jgi:uncharacterized protein YjbI with pentapeptide repeats
MAKRRFCAVRGNFLNIVRPEFTLLTGCLAKPVGRGPEKPAGNAFMAFSTPAKGRFKPTTAELTAILANHERFVNGRGGARASFKGADLTNAILANRRLDEADFTGATLAGANLHGTSLTRASLFCADLTGCNLRNAKLDHADLRGACFRNADLSFGLLDYADLRQATMMVMNEDGIAMVDYTKAGDGSVDFRFASLRNASLGKAKLDGAIFDGALLLGTNFRGAEISRASFAGAVLMDVVDLALPHEMFSDCVLDVTPAARAKAGALREKLTMHQRWVSTDGHEANGAVLNGEDLRPLAGQLAGRCLIGLAARSVIAIGLDFSRSQLQGAKFDGADLRGADFSGADLSGASFFGAKLVHARFFRTTLGNVTLRNGDVLQPNFFGSDASFDQFREASVVGELADLGVGTPDVVAL